MAVDKAINQHLEHPEQPDHEAALTGALALANLFSNCVEAFGLIHPSHKWEKEEQLLLSRLGIQQARLLIWGDIVGISSPPKTVTNRAVPKHPSAAYPDLKEPTFFGPRDARLDDPKVRTEVESALSAIVDRSAGHSREEMMEKYGLKPPKRFAAIPEAALDTQRLDGFREKYELLQEVGEEYAHLNTRRSNSIIQTSWMIADYTRFSNFIKLTQEKIDFLINLLGVREGIDRGMRMDIRMFGWHVVADRQRIALDTSKLRLLQEICHVDYPEYVQATQQALDNISRDSREKNVRVQPFGASAVMPPLTPEKPALPKSSHAPTNGHHEKQKRPGGLFGLFKSFGKSHDRVPQKGRSLSVAEETPRSKSDAGPVTGYVGQPADHEDGGGLEPIRSKSVGAILEPPAMSMDEEFIKNKLEQMQTKDTVKEPLEYTDAIDAKISRHDQYRGLARTDTKDLRQGY